MSAIYTATATSTGGGRNGRASTSDGRLELDLAVPKEMGGTGEGTNPEQLFAVGYAACLHSALQAAARQEKTDLGDSSVTADVHILDNHAGGYQLAVELVVELSGLDQLAAEKLAAQAHEMCPYSNAVRGNVDVSMTTRVR